MNPAAAFVRSTEERLNKDAVQSKVSGDWLEIIRSDLYSEICIDKKKRLRETETLHEGNIRDNSNARHIYLSQKLHVGISIRKQYRESYEN